MALLSEPEAPAPARRWRRYGSIALLLAAGGAYFLLTRPGPAPDVERPAPVEPPPADLAAPAGPENAPSPAPTAGRADAAAPEPRAEPAATDPPADPPPPPAVVLRVTSDVDGAEVFIDRRYAGTTPFESSDVEPGRRRINVSAPGYDGHSEDVEITGEPTTVAVRFREVRLDQRVAVVHKHRFGDCEGDLVADTGGITYRTDDDDAFHVALDALDEFAVDYLEHNLRLKVRDGRTYNFTDREENADALFVFHREVEEARARLARGDPPASE